MFIEDPHLIIWIKLNITNSGEPPLCSTAHPWWNCCIILCEHHRVYHLNIKCQMLSQAHYSVGDKEVQTTFLLFAPVGRELYRAS